MNTATKQRAAIRDLLAHPRCNEEIRVSLVEARRALDVHHKLSARWEVRLMRYADALRLADDRAAIEFTDASEVRGKQGALEKLLRQWIKHV